jgi:hypothetical protein
VYCRRYHRAENPNAANQPIDNAELQGYVKRTLKLVGCLLEKVQKLSRWRFIGLGIGTLGLAFRGCSAGLLAG